MFSSAVKTSKSIGDIKTWTTSHLHSLSVQETWLLAAMLRLPLSVTALGSYAFHARENPSSRYSVSLANNILALNHRLRLVEREKGDFTSLCSPTVWF